MVIRVVCGVRRVDIEGGDYSCVWCEAGGHRGW